MRIRANSRRLCYEWPVLYHPFNLELCGRYFEATLFIFKDLKDTVNTGENIREY